MPALQQAFLVLGPSITAGDQAAAGRRCWLT